MLYCSWPPDASTMGVHLTVHCILNCMLQNVRMTLCSTAHGLKMPVLGVHLTVHCILNCMLQNVTMTLCSTAHSHYIPALGGTSDVGMIDSNLPSQLHSSTCQTDLV